jgi:hypothetical protein
MASASEILAALFSQISEPDRAAIGRELNVENLEDVVASISPQGNMAVKPNPAILSALLRRIDPTDTQISQLVESGVFDTRLDLSAEADLEIVITFDSPRARDGALPLTDITTASDALTALLKSIVKAHQPLGVELEMPLVIVFTGSYKVRTKRPSRALYLSFWLLVTVVPLIESHISAVTTVVEATEDARDKNADVELKHAQTKLAEAQRRVAEKEAALKDTQMRLAEAQIKALNKQSAAQGELAAAQTRAAEADAVLKNERAKLAEADAALKVAQAKHTAEATAVRTKGNAAGEARKADVYPAHPASFFVSNELINQQAQDLGVEPAYIDHVLNRTLPAFRSMLSELGDLSVDASTVPRDKT